jgi:hypothetical protein
MDILWESRVLSSTSRRRQSLPLIKGLCRDGDDDITVVAEGSSRGTKAGCNQVWNTWLQQWRITTGFERYREFRRVTSLMKGHLSFRTTGSITLFKATGSITFKIVSGLYTYTCNTHYEMLLLKQDPLLGFVSVLVFFPPFSFLHASLVHPFFEGRLSLQSAYRTLFK